MASRNEIIEEIRLFIIRNDWGGTRRLKESTSVEEDMGITGLDAVDFINEFAKEFHVDISEFDYSKYFYAEGGIDLINPILNLFRKEEERVNLKPQALTLGHLADAVTKRKLT